MATKKTVRQQGIPFEEALAERMKDPAFRDGFEQRRLVHEVALAVRAMREQAGMTQRELGEAIGVAQSMIARLEHGADQRKPRFDLLRRIGLALGRQLKIVFAKPRKAQHLVEVEGMQIGGER